MKVEQINPSGSALQKKEAQQKKKQRKDKSLHQKKPEGRRIDIRV